MIDLLPYQQSIENAISDLNLPNKPNNLYDPLRYFMKIGGKRMRPILALMACELFGKPKESALNAALAVEIFHNFSLIHDDIMDKAPLRRGHETVHKKWNENIAILSGDVLFVRAYMLIGKYKGTELKDLLEIFNQTALEVCEGQQLDMDFETAENVNISDYLKMIANKTAVLLGCSLEMGAIVANATATDRKALYEFGVNLGIAFQLQDDLLDVYGDKNKFGKQPGGDILSNKKTFLLLTAQKGANESQKKRLLDLQNSSPNAKKVELVTELYDDLNVKHLTKLKIQEFYDVAMSNLNSLSVSEQQKKPLYALSEFIMNREN